MNKRDAINHIRQFGGRLDRFRKSVGGSGDGGRNAPKRAKSSPKPVNRKTNVFNEQVRYAFHGALQDLKSKPFATFLTVMVIAISLTLPSVCYMVYKNVNQAATQYYPSPQITVYLQKTLDDDAAAGVVAQLQAEQGVEKVNYLSREDALGEFRNWSGFGGALDMLEENPLPAVAVVIPKLDFQGTESLNTLRDRIMQINGIDEVRMDDSWFARLTALTGLVGRVSAMIGVLMVAAVFLVIGNSVRLSIFARHPGDHAVQIRDFQRWPYTGSFAVHLKSTSLNGIGLILPPLPGDWFTFFVLLITEEITISADLCQINFPEHDQRGLLRFSALIECFLLYILHQ